MGFVFFCFGTIAISFFMHFKLTFRILKDLADAGYKFEMDRMKELSYQLDPNGSKNGILQLFIPGYNLMKVFKTTVSYNEGRDFIIDQFRALGVIEEMEDLEKIEYEKKPTGFNALMVPIKVQTRIDSARKLTFDKDNYKGELIFTSQDGFKNINILKATGPISLLPEEEQKKLIIKEDFAQIEKRLMDRIDRGEVPNEFKGRESEMKEIEIRILRSMRNELLGEKDKEETSVQEIEPSKTYVKK